MLGGAAFVVKSSPVRPISFLPARFPVYRVYPPPPPPSPLPLPLSRFPLRGDASLRPTLVLCSRFGDSASPDSGSCPATFLNNSGRTKAFLRGPCAIAGIDEVSRYRTSRTRFLLFSSRTLNFKSACREFWTYFAYRAFRSGSFFSEETKMRKRKVDSTFDATLLDSCSQLPLGGRIRQYSAAPDAADAIAPWSAICRWRSAA